MQHKESRKHWTQAAYCTGIALLLIGFTVISYYSSLHYNFQFDDVANITKYFAIRHNTFASLAFKSPRWISYWLNAIHYSIGMFDPFSYRVGNLIIHTCNGLLVFAILVLLLPVSRQLFFSRNSLLIAVLTSTLFLLHPVQTQTVSYVIQGQLEGLAAFFILSMLLVFIGITRVQGWLMRSILIVLLFVLALFSCGTKEIAIIGPSLILLVDWFCIAQGDLRELKKRQKLHGALCMVVGLFYLYLLKPRFFTEILGLQRVAKNNIGNVITHEKGAIITPYIFFISQFKVILHYLWMFVWPFGISVEYDWMVSRSFFAPDSFFPFIGLCGIAWYVIRLLVRCSSDLRAFGLVWFFVCLAPRSSIIPSPELLVDYKTYLASFGWLFVLASFCVAVGNYAAARYQRFDSLQRHGAFMMALGYIAFVGGPLGFLTHNRNQVWSSGTAFWGNVIKNAPNKARAYNNYGVELSQNKKAYAEAVPYFKKAMSMDSNYSDPCNNLAVAYSHLGKTDEAIGALQRSLKINPYYPEGYNNLASFYLQKKDLDRAEQCLNNAIKLRTYYGKAHFNRGRIYLERGDNEKAWECFKVACIQGDLDNETGFSVYAQTSMTLKKYPEAIEGYTKLLRLNPGHYDGKFNLATAYFLTKDFTKAVSLYKELEKQRPDDVRVQFNLGESLVMCQDYGNALKAFEKLGAMKDRFPNSYLRIAQCYEKLGETQKAKETLHSLLQEGARTSVVPDSIKQTAKVLLSQIEGRSRERVL